MGREPGLDHESQLVVIPHETTVIPCCGPRLDRPLSHTISYVMVL